MVAALDLDFERFSLLDAFGMYQLAQLGFA